MGLYWISTGVDSRDGNTGMRNPQGWGNSAEEAKKVNANAFTSQELFVVKSVKFAANDEMLQAA